ncbi:Monocarboxylate transporter 9 [Armadillidium vulgare]|nr:Monocarboxylate transporter 9 [Armadillidium vulgare]
MKKNSIEHIKHEEVELVPPDGGWGWVVVFGSFLTMVVGGLPIFGFSILFSPLLISYKASSTKIAWIFNSYGIGWSFFVLFVGPLIEEFGWRKVSIIGALLNFFSVFLTSFAPNPDFLFFSFSLLGGVGNAICLTSSLIVVSRYFERHRGFVIGVTSVGGCVSAFIGPVLANYLLENYDFTGASLIYSGIVLHQCFGCSLFQPVDWHMKPAKSKLKSETDPTELLPVLRDSDNKENSVTKSELLQNSRRSSKISGYSIGSLEQIALDISYQRLKTTEVKEGTKETAFAGHCLLCKKILVSTYQSLKNLRYIRVVIIALACGFYMLSYINFQMWIPFVVKSADFSLEMAAWCSSAASLGNMAGRIFTSFLADRKIFNVIYGYMFGTLCTGISVLGK